MLNSTHLTLTGLIFIAASTARADEVVFLAADEANHAQESLRGFIAGELADAFELDCTLLTRGADGSVPGMEALAGAALAVVFMDAGGITGSERELFDDYVRAGRPLVLIRASVEALPDDADFHLGCTGANLLGAWEAEDLLVGRHAKDPEHPLVQDLPDSFTTSGPLYRVTPLAETATPVLWGGLAPPTAVEPEPVAWTSGYKGASIFVTTLGAPGDFRQPAFVALLRRAVFWGLGRQDLSGAEPMPVLDETNSVSVFDGESLEGWTNHGGRYDGNARWNVEEGVLVGRQGPGKSGGLLYTSRPYKNFLLSFETRIDYPFDSGVFVHMVPPDQGGKGIQVTLDYRPGGQIGGIYADGYLKQKPDSTELLKRDEWNRVVVRCKDDDMHVTAWLNGELLMDYVTPAGTQGFADTGLIGLQVHGGEDVPPTQRAMFRDIRIRELPHYDSELFSVDDRGILATTEAGARRGWVSMFNGSNLEGWDPRPAPKSYRVEDGVLVFPVEGGSGEIRSLQEYRDFELRLDFKIARMANSGLFLRAAPEGNPAYSGCEVQILDDFNWEKVTNSKLAPYQFCGGLYGAVAPGIKSALRPLGDWNTYEVRYVGSRISVRLNHYLLYDVDTFEVEASPPFAERAQRGFIGLQRHGTPDAEGQDFAWFRNIFVRELEEERGE
jgi:hypothetical protein